MKNVQDMLKKLKLTFQVGKGDTQIVPILFPTDLCCVVSILADTEIRSMCGVDSKNPYVFATTSGNPDTHSNGWAAVNITAEAAGCERPDLITADRNRHRVCTKFEEMEEPDASRRAFYDHVGHRENIDKHHYRTPPAVRELMTIGKAMCKMDEGGFSK